MPVAPSAYRIGSPTLAASSAGRISPALRGILHGAGIAPDGSIMAPTDIHDAMPGGNTLAGAAAGVVKPTLTQQAQGEIDPIVKSITDAITARAKAAGTAISGYSGALASDLGKEDFGAPWAGAQGQQAAVDSSLASALAGGGLSEAQGLQSRLAQIGEPGVVDTAANAVQATGTGNSNTVLAQGSSNLGELIANEAAAKSYGQKLPGIARLAGLQDISAANEAAQTQIGDKTTTVMDQLPSIVNSLRSAQIARAANAATNKYRTDSLTASNLKGKAAVIISTGIDPATGTLTSAASTELGKLYGIDPAALHGTSATVASHIISANNKPPTLRSVSPGHTLVDSTGKVIYTAPPAPAKPPKPGAGSAATGGLTASGWRTLVGNATKLAGTLATTVAPHQHFPAGGGDPIPVPGTGKAATSYTDARNQIFALGPSTDAWANKAQQIVDNQYAPGEAGRPWGAAAVPTALKTAKLALQNGKTAQEAHDAMVAVNLPADVVAKALARVYSGKGK